MSALERARSRDYLAVRRALGYKLARAGKLLAQFLAWLRRARRRHDHDRAGARVGDAAAGDRLRTGTRTGCRSCAASPRTCTRSTRRTRCRRRTCCPARTRRRRALPLHRRRDPRADGRRERDPDAAPRRDDADADRAAGRHRDAHRRGDPPRPRRHRPPRTSCSSSATASSASPASSPLHPTTIAALRRLPAPPRPALSRAEPTDAVFTSATGTRLTYCNVHSRSSGSSRTPGCDRARRPAGPGRTTCATRFAVNTLLDAYRTTAPTSRRGCRCCRPTSGTSTPKHTYWYLQAAPELLALAADGSSAPATETGDDRARADAAGVLHRAADRPAPRQPAHDRRLPRHAPAAAALRRPARPASSRQRWTSTISTRR